MNAHLADPASRQGNIFQDFIRSVDFPCVGAKSALARGQLKILPAADIRSAWNDLEIHRELIDWAADYRANKKGFRSLAVLFDGPVDLDEEEFERALWDRVQSLADKDSWKGIGYDPRVSANPDDPHFSLSFGGEAFFIVGLHPRASRPARRFERPVLVFNLHDQFEQLREEGRYEKMRRTILERDEELAGSINPMLARHGDSSEAIQYSGRRIDGDWTCPFHDPRAAS